VTEILKIEGMETYYGEVQVLRDISLDVQSGEIVALLGANGAGKSTTLRAISGLLPIKKGRVHFMGQDITHLAPHMRSEMGLSHVPEGRQLFPRLTVLENLKAAAYTRRAREGFKTTVETIFNMFPILKERRNQLAKTLSGGEQQMLAIARSLVLKPKLAMLDEPSLGLSPKLVNEVIQLSATLRDQGTNVFLVEQNVHAALRICDRAYVLETGRIVKHGTGPELLKDHEVKKAYLGL